MKHLFLFLLLFSIAQAFAFRTTNTEGPTQFEKARPKPDKYILSNYRKIDLNKFQIHFFDNLDLKGKPVIEWNKQGVLFQGQVVCGWDSHEDGKPLVSLKCSDEVPFGSLIKDPATISTEVPEKYRYIIEEEKHELNVGTLIEVERFEKVSGKKIYDYKTGVFVIKYDGKEFFSDLKKVIDTGWFISEGGLLPYKEKSLEMIQNKKFIKFIDEVKKCVELKDVKCLAKMTKVPFNDAGRVLGESYWNKTPLSIQEMWKVFFKKAFEDTMDSMPVRLLMKEMKFVFDPNHFKFPCLCSAVRAGDSKIRLIGEKYYFLLENVFLKSGIWRNKHKLPDEWKLIRIGGTYQEGGEPSINFCHNEIHSKQESTIMVNGITMSKYELGDYHYDIPRLGKEFDMKIWLLYYRKLKKEKGPKMSGEEWSKEYRNKGYMLDLSKGYSD